MAITSLTYQRVLDFTRVLATSSLGPPVFFAWYLDGAFLSITAVGQKDFQISPGDQARVDVLDTTDPAFDPIANAPTAYPARRSLWWVRSLSVDVDYYLVEQQAGGGQFQTMARVPQTPEAWALGWTSPRLTDVLNHTWRVTPYDAAGNAGTSKTFGPEKVVRRPDAPNFTVSASGGLVTYTGA